MSLLLSLCLSSLASPAQAAPPAAPRPNIVVVLADDLGWGDLSSFGNRAYTTPNIDRLAQQGSAFGSFYVAAPTCSPSRAAFVSGRFPSEVGIFGPLHVRKDDPGVDWLDPELPSLAGVLGGAGYRTAHFGKWHLGAPAEGAPPLSSYGFERSRVAEQWTGGRSLWRTDRAGSSKAIVDAALEFIAADDERPFFVQLWMLDPHGPLTTAVPRLDNYKTLGPASGDPPGALALYAAHVGELDLQVGRLTAALAKRKLVRDTLVLFTSDNGPEVKEVRNASYAAGGSPGPFRGVKRSLYEGGLRVPLIAHWPGTVPAGRFERESVLSAVDLLPTLASLAGASVDERWGLDGEDVSDVLLGADRPRSTPLFYESRVLQKGRTLDRSPTLALRDGDHVLLADPGGAGRVELYDVVRDPQQLRDLAGELPERTAALRSALADWFDGLAPRADPDPALADPWPWPLSR